MRTTETEVSWTAFCNTIDVSHTLLCGWNSFIVSCLMGNICNSYAMTRFYCENLASKNYFGVLILIENNWKIKRL